MNRSNALRTGLLPLLALTIAAQEPPPGVRNSPPLNKTWRVTAHNAFWQGPWGNEPAASGPRQHILDSLVIDRSRGLEFDLHSNHNDKKFYVYHTDREDYSMCQQFDSCLDIVRAWHFANPAHDVLFVHMEIKETGNARFFGQKPTDVTPADLDTLVGGKLRHGTESWIFTPKNYLDWCSAKLKNPAFGDSVAENIQLAVATCGWPTMGELRGKIILTLHGNWLDNEYDVFEYSYKLSYYGRGIRDVLAFPMAGAIGKGSQGHECSDEGKPDGAHWGNVCNFTPQSVIMDLLTVNPGEYTFNSPLAPNPGVAAQILKNNGFLFRSGDRDNLLEMLEARATLYGTNDSGFNMIASNAMRLNPLNNPQWYQDRRSFAAGCLLNRVGRTDIAGCQQRTLQCVASLGVVLIVASTSGRSRSSVIVLGRPERSRSSNKPATPAVAKRSRQSSTVGKDVWSSRAS